MVTQCKCINIVSQCIIISKHNVYVWLYACVANIIAIADDYCVSLICKSIITTKNEIGARVY